MKIDFQIDGIPARYVRNWITGKAVLTVGEQKLVVQSFWNPATHGSKKLTRAWEITTHNHRIKIEKVRPLLFAGGRAQSYRIFVDDQLVAEKSGF